MDEIGKVSQNGYIKLLKIFIIQHIIIWIQNNKELWYVCDSEDENLPK